MAGFLNLLETVGVVLGAWTVVALVTALALIPWFRAQARANLALTRLDRREDWLVAAHPANVRTNEVR
jgi:hypothetical protein